MIFNLRILIFSILFLALKYIMEEQTTVVIMTSEFLTYHTIQDAGPMFIPILEEVREQIL